MKTLRMNRCRRLFRPAGFRAMTGVILWIPALAGCPGVAPIPGGDGATDFVDGNRDETVISSLGKTFGEPNDDFAIPVVVVFDSMGVGELKGSVETSDDLDVFLLDPLEVGDRVIVDAFAAGSGSLDVSIALFDGERRLVSDNDDRTPSNLDARIEFVVRHAGDRYYLVVTRSAFASVRREVGAYTADVRIIRGGAAPPPLGQIVFLDFDGGPVDSPVLGSMTLAPFNAAEIDRVYTGDTETIKRMIVDVFEENYARFDVTIVTSDDPAPARGTAFSTIIFGGYNDAAFGISENVDLYNADCCDDAIIFTESFSPFLFSTTPTAEEMGLAIGNVAAHEVGHLLGLNHVDEDFDLMDDRSPADAFLLDQEFMESPLSTDIMPIGTQDGVLLLDETVGPSEDLVATRMHRRLMLSRVDPEHLKGSLIVRRQSHRSAGK